MTTELIIKRDELGENINEIEFGSGLKIFFNYSMFNQESLFVPIFQLPNRRRGMLQYHVAKLFDKKAKKISYIVDRNDFWFKSDDARMFECSDDELSILKDDLLSIKESDTGPFKGPEKGNDLDNLLRSISKTISANQSIKIFTNSGINTLAILLKSPSAKEKAKFIVDFFSALESTIEIKSHEANETIKQKQTRIDDLRFRLKSLEQHVKMLERPIAMGCSRFTRFVKQLETTHGLILDPALAEKMLVEAGFFTVRTKLLPPDLTKLGQKTKFFTFVDFDGYATYPIGITPLGMTNLPDFFEKALGKNGMKRPDDEFFLNGGKHHHFCLPSHKCLEPADGLKKVAFELKPKKNHHYWT